MPKQAPDTPYKVPRKKKPWKKKKKTLISLIYGKISEHELD